MVRGVTYGVEHARTVAPLRLDGVGATRKLDENDGSD